MLSIALLILVALIFAAVFFALGWVAAVWYLAGVAVLVPTAAAIKAIAGRLGG